MAGIIKNVVRLGVITTLAGGAVVLVAGPQRCLAVLQQVKQHVNATIDANIDDPIALRSQLRNLEAKYPVRIKEVRRDLYKIQSERGQLERELAVDYKAIEITQGKLGQLRHVLARGREIEQDGSRFVRIRFDHDRMDMGEANRLAGHFDRLVENFQASAHERDLYLDMLIDQENQLAEVLGQLQTEQLEFQTQLAQLDRQVDAIARNDRLITILQERQAAFSKYDNPYSAPNSDAVRAKILRVLADQEREIAQLSAVSERDRIVKEAQQALNVMRSVRRSIQGHEFQPTVIELETPVIEIAPGDDTLFETEGEIASRGG